MNVSSLHCGNRVMCAFRVQVFYLAFGKKGEQEGKEKRFEIWDPSRSCAPFWYINTALCYVWKRGLENQHKQKKKKKKWVCLDNAPFVAAVFHSTPQHEHPCAVPVQDTRDVLDCLSIQVW